MEVAGAIEQTRAEPNCWQPAQIPADSVMFTIGSPEGTADVGAGDEPAAGLGATVNLTPGFDSRSTVRPVQVEVCVSQFNVENFSTIEARVVEYLRTLGPRHVPTELTACQLTSPSSEDPIRQTREMLRNCVSSISLLLDDVGSADGYDVSRSVDLRVAPLVVHVYSLVTGDEAVPVHELIEVGSETIDGGTLCLLPSVEMQGLWESLIFDSAVKLDLLNYAQTALYFSERQVSSSVITWNRVVLLYGPPGTGKTSLCRALANKLAIRLSNRFSSAKLIELNTMNLMSKWFSESARLVARMFEAIREYLDSPSHLVCLLVDEVESLTAVRTSAMSGCEPSDAIRVVNAVLTQIDQIKRYPNVLILATSNVTSVIDPAFLDRADIRIFISPPSAPAIYTIYRSCVEELVRVGLVQARDSQLLSYRTLNAMQFTENKMNSASLMMWNLAKRSVGLNGRTLRKLPLLAHAFHLSKLVPHLRLTCSFVGGPPLHLPAQPPNTFTTAGSAKAHPQTPITGDEGGGAVHLDRQEEVNRPSSGSSSPVPLHIFLEALKLTVDDQFSDIRALDLASSSLTTALNSRLSAVQPPPHHRRV